ncbi:UNVERIFIED_CONTAM: hypothetical protein K2H54_043495 [Gekko kuhli]
MPRLAVLFGLILLPLRALAMLLILLTAWPFAFLATSCSCQKAGVPLVGWKRSVSISSLRFLGRALFFAMGFHVKVRGKPASCTEAAIFTVAPHSSFFDGIACVLAGLPSIVSRTENLNAPILGRILQALQPILVSRLDPDSRSNTINEISRRTTLEEGWPQILVFPEGTCTNRSCLITFKQGAFIPGVPVQPVVIRYPNKRDTVTWTWQGNTFLEALVLTLCQLYTNVEVEFLPVYIPTCEEKKSPVLFANEVRCKMACALDVPVTDHTYEDCRLMISAGQLTLPMEAGLVEFTKISKKLNLNWGNIRDQLDQFAAIASASKGGRIRIDEFAGHLKLPISDVLEELFALFDRPSLAMFLAEALLNAATGGGGGSGGGSRSVSSSRDGGSGGAGGALVRGLGSLLAGGSGGKKGGNFAGFVGGLVNIISEAAAQYTPEPPPEARSHYANVEASESEEVRQFRRLFAQLAGDDMEVCPTELRNILNKVVARHQDLKSGGFSLDTCRSMVAVMDSDTTGKLGFEQFKYLWNNIKKWQCVYKQYRSDTSGAIERPRLPAAFKAAGFRLHEQLYALIVRRYADEDDGSMDFNSFIGCLVRLDGMFRAFKALDRRGDGKVQMNIEDWLQLTMYS